MVKLGTIVSNIEGFYQSIIDCDAQNRVQRLNNISKDLARSIQLVTAAIKSGKYSNVTEENIFIAAFVIFNLDERVAEDWSSRLPNNVQKAVTELHTAVDAKASDEIKESSRAAASEKVDEWLGEAAEAEEDAGNTSDAESEYEVETGDYARVWAFFGLQLEPENDLMSDEEDEWSSDSEEEFDSKWLKSSDEEEGEIKERSAAKRHRERQAAKSARSETAALRPTLMAEKDWDAALDAVLRKARTQKAEPQRFFKECDVLLHRTDSAQRRARCLLEMADIVVTAHYETNQVMEPDAWFDAWAAVDAAMCLTDAAPSLWLAAHDTTALGPVSLEAKVAAVTSGLYRELVHMQVGVPVGTSSYADTLAGEKLLAYLMARVSAVFTQRMEDADETVAHRLRNGQSTLSDARVQLLCGMTPAAYADIVGSTRKVVADFRRTLPNTSRDATAPVLQIALQETSKDVLGTEFGPVLANTFKATAARVLATEGRPLALLKLSTCLHLSMLGDYTGAAALLDGPDGAADIPAVHTDTTLQMLANRCIVAIGLAAFKDGKFDDAAYILADLTSAPRFPDLIGQSGRTDGDMPGVPTHRFIPIETVAAAALVAALVSDGLAHAAITATHAARAGPKPFRKIAFHLAASGHDAVPVAKDAAVAAVVIATRALLVGDVSKALEALGGLSHLWAAIPATTVEAVSEHIKQAIVGPTGLSVGMFIAANLGVYRAIGVARLSRMLGVEEAIVVATATAMIEAKQIDAVLEDGFLVANSVEGVTTIATKTIKVSMQIIADLTVKAKSWIAEHDKE
ncbi:Eukaryotic translation initiation factor 3 subunit 8 N-terminus [Carpediemonas membranifera]|uniref:Eukaryotic translation initiation factor 3 subunit 8 N-terminus n=1 Tax=Carpediemonas membranifera TaxID=201153 RepID=A0A8J6BC35_9EUKA|nr:Eukaryotic translation initiation factor 3 subunit 8 N-terminus [Carpediemonas membranifera]|eukprot:KAG9397142.1 Eukaryotic translation initiation factor 3 subunit 8 N-terminus [Carpediemonas membranifera]